MIKTKRIRFSCLALIASVSVLVAGCATTTVQYKKEPKPQDGSINILLSRAAPKLSVVMDDDILVDARVWGTRRVNVENIPPGKHQVKVFASSWHLSEPVNYSESVEVPEGGEVPVIMQVPPYSTMYWVYVIAVGVVSAIPVIIVYR